MIQTHATEPEKLLKKAYKVAETYGFLPPQHAFREYKKKKVTIKPYKLIADRRIFDIATLLQTYFEYGLHLKRKPVFLFHSNISKDTTLKNNAQKKKTNNAHCTFTIIGIEDAYAEAIILSCVTHIFRKMKSDEHRVRINSIGTTANAKEYVQKLSKTVKKMGKQIHPECKKLLKESQLFEAHRCLYNNDHAQIHEHIVPTLRLLSDNARVHFEQVIECLEAYDLTYELSPDLVESPQHSIHTIFEVVEDNFPLYAQGGRYDTLSTYAYRRKTPVVSVTITTSRKTTGNHIFTARPKKPKVLFFHAGEKARIHSLRVLAKLCDANIPVSHRLYHKKVSDQIDDCEHLYPYTIIFGQEEIENGVLCIRKNDTRATSTVQINEKSLASIKKFIQS